MLYQSGGEYKAEDGKGLGLGYYKSEDYYQGSQKAEAKEQYLKEEDKQYLKEEDKQYFKEEDGAKAYPYKQTPGYYADEQAKGGYGGYKEAETDQQCNNVPKQLPAVPE